MTQSLEDYLETIYLLTEEKKVARVKDISEKLNVKKPSVITALKDLERRNFILHEKYGYIELTFDGLNEAKIIFKKHTMLKNFLTNVIGVSEIIAETDACSIEHCLSEETLSKIEIFMNKYKIPGETI
jgi:DtxR family transcriptional regulator, Mn-dependent transcriptional regulator